MSAARKFRSVDNIASIWVESTDWISSDSTAWGERFDAALHEAVSDTHPLLLCGRNSNDSGWKGCFDAADDLHLAAKFLADNHGLDVRPILPPREWIADALMRSGLMVESEDANGGKFINRFLLIDLRAHGVVLSVSAGSGRKMTADFQQPHVQWLDRLAKDTNLAMGAMFFKRADRMAREYWAIGTLLHRLRHLEAQRHLWVGDGKRGRWDLDAVQDIIRFVEATGSAQEADGFVLKRLASQRAHTGASMTDYRVPYALHSACPPGTYRYQPHGSKRWMLAIDSPDLYPHDDPTAGTPRGVPHVLLSNGELANQVTTIRWLLAELGKPGQGLRELWPGLISRGYSTETLRLSDGQGARAYYGGPSKPTTGLSWDYVSSWSRSIIENLDFYETGTLIRSISPSEDPIVITECFPPAGCWADPADFERIRRYLRDRKRAASTRTSWSWSGMPVTVNGIAGRSGTPRTPTERRDVLWPVVLDTPLPDGDPALRGAGFVPSVPDDQLTAGIVESLKAASGRPLLAALANSNATAEDLAISAELDEVTSRRGILVRRAGRQHEDVYAENPETGEPLIPGSMRIEMMKDLDRLRAEIEELAARQHTLEERLDAVRVDAAGVDIGDLQVVLDGLHNPRTNMYRERLGRAIKSIDLRVSDLKRDRLRGRSVSFSGEIILESSSGPRSIPFRGAYELGAASEADKTTIEGIARLRAGCVATNYPKGSRERLGVKLALEALGADPGHFALRACEDSRLLKVGMAALFPDPAHGEDPADVPTIASLAADPSLAHDFGDLDQLAERIRHVYATRKTPRWLLEDGVTMEVDLMTSSIADARDSSRPTYDSKQLAGFRQRMMKDDYRHGAWSGPTTSRPRLAPCVNCGSRWLVPMRIAEVAGYLCLECRRDQAGIRWPERFDRFVAGAQRWKDIGAPLSPLPLDDTAPARVGRRRLRLVGQLSGTERSGLVAAYVDGHRKVADIARDADISASTLMAVVRDSGVPTRYGATRTRWNTNAGRGDDVR